jgi:hypothetical protein
MGNLPINTIVFGARGHADRFQDLHFPRKAEDIASGKPSYLRVSVSSMWAGTLQLIVVIPVENVKVKLQVQHTPVKMSFPAAQAVVAAVAVQPASAAAAAIAAVSSVVAPAVSTAAPAPSVALYSGPWDCVKQLYRSGGLRAVYAGTWVTTWRDVPAYAAWFVAYEATRVALTSDADLAAGAPVSTQTALLAGSVAGAATWLSTYPFDVLKSVIQTAGPNTPPAELKMAYVARKAYQAHGASYFFKGLAPTLLRAVPVSAVTFYVYERCMDLFGR